MRVVVVSLLAIFLFSCRKHDHRQVVPESCALCGYADQLEGSYYGKAEGYGVTGYIDSLRVTVEHFFKSEGAYIDSTIMFLRLTSVYKSQPLNENIRVIEMHTPEDFTYFSSPDPMRFFTLNPEEMHIYSAYYGMGSGQQLSIDYTGFRE